jgi:V/A-type H+/Na+-transporting ATPase subunit G/H
MVDDKTLLQQIRDKEQQVSKNIEAVKKETEAVIATAKSDAEKIIREAEASGKSAADELYLTEKIKIQVQVEEMKKKASSEVEKAKTLGEKNLNAAVETIVNRVTMG